MMQNTAVWTPQGLIVLQGNRLLHYTPDLRLQHTVILPVPTMSATPPATSPTPHAMPALRSLVPAKVIPTEAGVIVVRGQQVIRLDQNFQIVGQVQLPDLPPLTPAETAALCPMCQHMMMMGGGMPMGGGMTPPEPARDQIEIDFLTMTIDHHEGALQMARLVEQRATHPELKALASKIIKSQTQQQQQMQRWLKEWYDRTKAPMIMEENKAVVDRLSGLRGAEFEIAFLREMIKHHRMGIPMMEPAAKNAAHPDARRLADKMIKDQQAEITQMQQWLKKWYNTGEGQ